MSTPAPYTAPGYGSAPIKEKKEEPPAYSHSTESAPVYSTGSIFDTSLGVSMPVNKCKARCKVLSNNKQYAVAGCV